MAQSERQKWRKAFEEAARACQTQPKATTEELMEIIDLFGVSDKARAEIRKTIEAEPEPPCANLFRYYNDRSKVRAFEEQFAAKMGQRFCLAVNSGTSALITALVAAEIGPGDEVIVPGYTFFASPASVVTARAVPILAEIDETLTLDPEDVRQRITPRTKAIMPVHMRGLPSNMDALMAVAREHNLKVIEDTAQACGGRYRGRYLGTIGDLGCISLDYFKVIQSGEGGVVLTDDEWLHTRAQSWHDTAACWRPDRYAKERRTGELFAGENYRMPEQSGAIALAQLAKLDAINENCRRAWQRLAEEVVLPGNVKLNPTHDADGVCGYSFNILMPDADTVRRLADRAAEDGIGVQIFTGGEDPRRDWHVYPFWEHILEKKTATEEGCPYTCPYRTTELPAYSKDMLPRTLDIVLRTAAVGLHSGCTGEYVDLLAEGLSRTLEDICD